MSLFLHKLRLYIGNDIDLIKFRYRELRARLECTDAVYFIAKQLNAARQIIGKLKYIDDANTYSKLTSLINEICFFEIVVMQKLFEESYIQLLAQLNCKRIGCK